jgi:membrane protease YdiL (CAAX protease family)
MIFRILSAAAGGGQTEARTPWRAGEKVTVVASLVLLGAIPFFPASDRLASFSTHGWILLLLAVNLVFALLSTRWEAAQLALIATLYLGAYCTPFIGTQWPLPLLVVLASYGIVLACVPSARRAARFWRRGSIDRATAAWIIVFTGLATAALFGWIYVMHVDLGRYAHFVPSNVPAWTILAGILPFAMLNAAFEELIWRGILWQSWESAFGDRSVLLVSSLSFGLAHYRGFPSGASGVMLALVYGLMMGLVRTRSGGLLAPWVAHVFADSVIYGIVAVAVCSP